MSLLTVSQVSKSYFSQTVLDKISLRLDAGERLALIGDNGAGKTTLLRLITGAEKPDEGSITCPSRVVPGYLSQHFDDEDELDGTALASRELKQIEEQMRELERMMAEEAPSGTAGVLDRYSMLTARYESLGGYDFSHRMEETLAGLGLSGNVLGRPLGTLSGGERMRVALARLLLRSPDLLLLDEPTNHLDLAAMEWLEDYIRRFKGAVILVSHDRAFIDRTATAVAELAAGHLSVYPGNYTRYREILADRQLAFEKEFKELSRELEHQRDAKQSFLSHRIMSGYHAREKVVSRLQDKLGELQSRAARLHQRLNFNFLPLASDGDPTRILLRAEGLAVRFGSRSLFRNVSFNLRGGMKACLCGPNGCGKTTLLSLLLGKVGHFDGEVSVIGDVIFGHMGQHVDFSNEDQSLLDEILSRAEMDEGQGRSLLARYGFRDVDVFKKISVLSGGERSRLYLCCLLLERPDLLLLDEPTNHLDIRSREILEKALLDFPGAVLSVSHDRYFIERCASSILGFIGDEVFPFDSFESYRKAARISEIARAARSAGSPPDAGGERTEAPRQPRQPTRAQERRETALHREKVRQMEKEIAALEQARQDAEASFAGQNDPEVYLRYTRLLADLDRLYDEYVNLEPPV